MDEVTRVKVLREAAAAICYHCAHDGKPTHNGNEWVHLTSHKAVECDAAAIHDLILSTRQPPKPRPTPELRGRRPEAVYRFVVMFNRASGRMPSLREILEATDITSVSVANYTLNRLENAGLIRRMPFITRGIELVRPLFYDWLPELDPDYEPSPCGHPVWAMAPAGEGPAYCRVCEFVASIRPVNLR